MLDTLSNRKCGNTLYLICIVILVILIILAIYYVIRESCKRKINAPAPRCSCEKEDFNTNTKENYVSSNGKVTDLGDGHYITTGNFHTSQEFEKEAKVDKNGQMRDFTEDPYENKEGAKKTATSSILWDVMERAKNHEILTEKQMQDAAKAYQESSTEGVPLYDRGTTLPHKMVISSEPVPVLKYRGDNKQSVPDFTGRAKGNTLVVAREIYEVPYYEFDGPKPKFQKGDKIFTKISTEDKVAMPMASEDTKNNRAQEISDNIYSTTNGKITFKGLGGSDISYPRVKADSMTKYSDEMFRIDNKANLVN